MRKGEREGGGERVLDGERRKKHLGGRKSYNKDVSKASFQLLLISFPQKDQVFNWEY